MDFWIISSLNRMFTSHGTPLDLSTVDNSKSQGDFYNKLQQVVHECSFTNADEVVKFLFLTHNQDKCVHEDLLKQMKETTTLSDMVHIAKTTESMIHSETSPSVPEDG